MISESLAADIRQQLARLLGSHGFIRSERMSRFLRFVVEETLAQDNPALKEWVIAQRVFDRGENYSPSNDPVVRVEARRLRSKLDEYYAAQGVADPIRIVLPKGSYVPVFEQRGV